MSWPRDDGFDITGRHTILDVAHHAVNTHAQLVLNQFTHGTHATIAEVVDIIRLDHQDHC
jgi:cystathionine beta-lyase family protein involved in aluminum resistance